MVIVKTLIDLNKAVLNPVPDMIIFCIGDFTGFNLKVKKFQNLTIAGYPGAPIPVFDKLFVYQSSGVTFAGVRTKFARVQTSSEIHFEYCIFTGDINLDDGLHIQGGSKGVSVSNSELHSLLHGVMISQSSLISLTNNNVHDIRADGFIWGDVQGLLIDRNTFYDWHYTMQDHPDAIQGTPGTGSSDVTISNNLIDGGNDPTKPLQCQGITCMTKGVVTNYTCTNNFIRNLMFGQGLMIDGANGGSITNNTVLGSPLNRCVFDNAGVVNQLTWSGNTCNYKPVNLSTGYTMIPLPSDGGDALLNTWKLTI